LDWLKLSSNGILRGSLANSPDCIQLTWIKMLALMSETHFRNGRFEYAQGKPYSLEFIAMNCGISIRQLKECLKEYENDINPNTNIPRIQWDKETLIITNWMSYQSKPEPKHIPLSVESKKAITRKLASSYPESAEYGIQMAQGKKLKPL
jgi:hypothetical protein